MKRSCLNVLESQSLLRYFQVENFKLKVVQLDGLVREQRSSWDQLIDTELSGVNGNNRRGAVMQVFD
jgi:hypothetical protein